MSQQLQFDNERQYGQLKYSGADAPVVKCIFVYLMSTEKNANQYVPKQKKEEMKVLPLVSIRCNSRSEFRQIQITRYRLD